MVLNTSLSAMPSLIANRPDGCLRCCRTREPCDADADRPVEDLRLQPAVPLRGESDLGPDLLEDPRRAAHERRLDDAQVLHDLGQIAVDRGAEAELQLHARRAPCRARGTSAATGTARRRGPGCPARRRPCPRRSSCRGPAGRPWAGRWCRRCRSAWPGPPGRSRRSACRRRPARSASCWRAAGGAVRPGSGCVDLVGARDACRRTARSPSAAAGPRPATLSACSGVLGEHDDRFGVAAGCRRRRARSSSGTPWWSRRRRTGSPGRTGSTRSGWSRRSRPAAAAATPRSTRPAARSNTRSLVCAQLSDFHSSPTR